MNPCRQRVLFVLADLESGGAQRVILTVVKHLNRSLFEPHLVVADPKGPLFSQLPGNVQTHFLGGRRVRYALPSLYRIIRKVDPRAVVSTLGHLNLALLATKRLLPKGTRLLVREANTPSARLVHTNHPRLYAMGFRMLYPRADRVLCNSVFMKNDLMDNFSVPGERISVLPNPVDAERIRNRAGATKNPYREGVVSLVSVGRLNRQKGFDLLLRAMSAACSEVARLSLTLVGDGPEAGALKTLSSRLGLQDRVVFAGHQDNPYPFMAHADLFVSSSRYEGSPNAVLESLTCGTPVLAFDCPGGTGEIITEGVNGWLVPAEDTGTMGARLIEIARHRSWDSLEAESLLPERFLCANAVRAYESLLMTFAVSPCA